MAQKLFAQDERYLSKNASEDLAAFYFVKLGTDAAQVDVADTAGEQVLGISEHAVDQSVNPIARIVYEGITYVVAGGTFAADDYLTTDANGKAVKAGGVAAADYIAGKAMSAGVAGSLAAIHLFPAGGASIADVGAGRKFFVIPAAIVAATTVNDTGYNMPAKAVVLEAFLDVTTLEATGATKTVDVGFLNAGESGDEDGLLDGASVAAAGLIGPSLANGAVTRGALLREDEDGAGAYVPSRDYTAGTRSITYTLGAADFAEMVANIVIDFIEVE